MDHSIAEILFSVAVLANFAAIAVGIVCALVVSFGRGVLAAAERREAAVRNEASFHHPDPVNTSLVEKFFMAGALALVLVGLPVALAAIFHYLVPGLGHAVSP